MKNPLSTLVILVALALVAAGCGGGDATSTAPTPGGDPNAQPVADPNGGGTGDPMGDAADQVLDSGSGQGTTIPTTDGSKIEGGFGSLYDGADVFVAKADMSEEYGSYSDDVFGASTESTMPTGTTSTTTTTTTTTYGPAVIVLDKKTYTVSKGSVFPSDTQQFTVSSIGSSTVELTLTAGEFSDGSDGITLEQGRTVTLVNQSEGVTYVLKLSRVKSSTTTS